MPNITTYDVPCRASHPFYNGSSCISCAKYFDYKNKNCTTCPKDHTFNKASHSC